MPSSLRARQPVLVAVLPMPAFGLALINEVVERLYGTGETMLDMSDSRTIRIIAPEDGFGPRVGAPLPPQVDTGGLVTNLRQAGETLDLTFEEGQEIITTISAGLTEWFDVAGGINYVTARFAAPGDDDIPFHITVQKTAQPTAHDLREKAEQRVAYLEQVLRDHGITPDSQDDL